MAQTPRISSVKIRVYPGNPPVLVEGQLALGGSTVTGTTGSSLFVGTKQRTNLEILDVEEGKSVYITGTSGSPFLHNATENVTFIKTAVSRSDSMMILGAEPTKAVTDNIRDKYGDSAMLVYGTTLMKGPNDNSLSALGVTANVIISQVLQGVSVSGYNLTATNNVVLGAVSANSLVLNNTDVSSLSGLESLFIATGNLKAIQDSLVVATGSLNVIQSSLVSATGNLQSVQSSLISATGNLATATGNLQSVQSSLVSATGNLATATGNLATVQSSLISATGNLATATGNLATVQSSLISATGNLATATGNLATVQSSLVSATGNLATATGNLNTIQASLVTATGNIINGTEVFSGTNIFNGTISANTISAIDYFVKSITAEDITTTGQRLNLRGSLTITGDTVDPVDAYSLKVFSPGLAASATEPFIVTSGGNVGIGQVVPNTKLDIKGSISAINITASSDYYINDVRLLAGLESATGNLQTVQSSLVSATGNLATATGNLQSVQSSLISATGNLATATGNLATVQSSLISATGNLATATGNLATVQSSLISATGNLATATGNLQTVQSSLISATGNLATATGNLQTVQSSLVSATGNLATATGNLQTVQSSLISATGNLATATGNLQTIQSSLVSATGNLATATGNLATVQSSLVSATGNLATATGNLATIQSSLVSATGNLATATGNLATVQSSLISATGNLATATGNLATVQSSLISATGNLATATGNNKATIDSLVTATGNIIDGTEVFSGVSVFNGTISGNSISAVGITGNTISAGLFYGDGSNLTDLPGGGGGGSWKINTESDGVFYHTLTGGAVVSASVSAQNVTATTNVFIGASKRGADSLFTATGNNKATIDSLVTATGNIIDGTEVFSGVSVFNGTISGNSISAVGITGNTISAGLFYGDGSNLTDLPGGGGGGSWKINTESDGVFYHTLTGGAVVSASVSAQNVTATTNVFIGASKRGADSLFTATGNNKATIDSLVSATGNLATATGNLQTIQSSLISATGNLATATGNLATVQSSLVSATGNLATATGNLATVQSSLVSATGNLATATGNLATVQSSLVSATGNLATATGNLNTIQSSLVSATGNLATVQSSLISATGNLATATGNLATVQSSLVSATGNLATATGNLQAVQSSLVSATGNIIDGTEVFSGVSVFNGAVSANSISAVTLGVKGELTVSGDSTDPVGLYSLRVFSDGIGSGSGTEPFAVLTSGNIGIGTTGVPHTAAIYKMNLSGSYAARNDFGAANAFVSFSDSASQAHLFADNVLDPGLGTGLQLPFFQMTRGSMTAQDGRVMFSTWSQSPINTAFITAGTGTDGCVAIGTPPYFDKGKLQVWSNGKQQKNLFFASSGSNTLVQSGGMLITTGGRVAIGTNADISGVIPPRLTVSGSISANAVTSLRSYAHVNAFIDGKGVLSLFTATGNQQDILTSLKTATANIVAGTEQFTTITAGTGRFNDGLTAGTVVTKEFKGWSDGMHGYDDRILIMPSDFRQNTYSRNYYVQGFNGDGSYYQAGAAGFSVLVSKVIPRGFAAYKATLYGSFTDTWTLTEGTVTGTSNTTLTSRIGSGSVNFNVGGVDEYGVTGNGIAYVSLYTETLETADRINGGIIYLKRAGT